MNRAVEVSVGDRRRNAFPAYGPVDAALGFAAFYVFVTRATPAIVEAFATAMPTVDASAVRFGLAAFLWFAFAVTTVDQLRRQLAALGAGDAERARGFWGDHTPSMPGLVVLVVAVVVGGAVAALTFDRAIVAGIDLVRAAAALDAGAVTLGRIAVLVVFFVSFEVATTALDRVVVGGLRAIVPG